MNDDPIDEATTMTRRGGFANSGFGHGGRQRCATCPAACCQGCWGRVAQSARHPETTAQAFMALQAGTAVTVAPVTGTPDDAVNPQGPFAGIVYGSGNLTNDLLPILAAGCATRPRCS